MAGRDMTEEPIIIINGKATTEAQAMTIRCALDSFYSTLREEGLGDDDHGRSMVNSYCKNIEDIRKLILME